jgi:spore germination cell wall hydrolase CwlJ-like protein
MRQNIMKSTIIWTLAVMSISTAFAQTQASTFIKPVQGELFTEERQPELYCLAQNIYFEAKSEPLAGQYAVADVVLNRVNDTRYPNTICEVVQEGPIKESWKTKQDTTLSDDERI